MLQPNETVLIADGYTDDAFFTEAALRRAGLGHRIEQVNDLYDAMRYLSGSGPFEDRERFPLPEVIFCDFWLGALDLLQWMSTKAELSHIRLVVMVGSDLEMDVQAATEAGAAAVFCKTPSLGELVERVTEACRSAGLELVNSRCEEPTAVLASQSPSTARAFFSSLYGSARSNALDWAESEGH